VLVNPDTDTVYSYQPSSRGGIVAISHLCTAYGRRTRAHPGELPLIELDASSYQHQNKSFGEIRTPVLRVVDWIKSDEQPVNAEPATEEMDDQIPF
jgi:hypothetical protein